MLNPNQVASQGPGGFLNLNGGPTDPYYALADGTPYPDVAAACAAVPVPARKTRTVNVAGVEMQWLSDTSDAGLQVKTAVGAVDFDEPVFTGTARVLGKIGQQLLLLQDVDGRTIIVDSQAIATSDDFYFDAGGNNLVLALKGTPYIQLAQGKAYVKVPAVFEQGATVPTPAASDASQQVANTAFVQAAINVQKTRLDNLVNGAPAALDTLAEIAAQLTADEQGAAGILATQLQHTQQIAALQGTAGKVVIISGGVAYGYDTLALALAGGKTRYAVITVNLGSDAAGIVLSQVGTFRGNGIYLAGTSASPFSLSASTIYDANLSSAVISTNYIYNSILSDSTINGTAANCLLRSGCTAKAGGTLTISSGCQLEGDFFATFTKNSDGTYTTPAGGTVVDARGTGAVTTAQLEAVRATARLTGAQAADYALKATDAGNIVPFSAAAICTIPVDTLPLGAVVEISQEGAGAVTIAGAAGVVIRTAGGLKTGGQWASVGLRQRAANDWVLTNGVA